MKNVCKIGGNVLSLTSDTSGRIFWAGNDKVLFKLYFYLIYMTIFNFRVKLFLSFVN